jgi:hypothetical protein
MTFLSNINFNHPIVFGLVAAVITFIIVKLDVSLENKRLKLKMDTDENYKCPLLKTSLKLPFIIGGLVWAVAVYFKSEFSSSLNAMELMNDGSSSSILPKDLELFTDMDFE